MRKYIRLYEEYTENDFKGLNTQHTWQEVRDVLQKKIPFIIIDFNSMGDFNKCIEEELYDEDFIKQTYIFKEEDSNDVKKPSVFIFAEGEKDLKDRVLNLESRHDIFRIIIGEFGEQYPKLYVDGEQINLGSNLFSSIHKNEMGSDDYYQFDSNYYRFIN